MYNLLIFDPPLLHSSLDLCCLDLNLIWSLRTLWLYDMKLIRDISRISLRSFRYVCNLVVTLTELRFVDQELLNLDQRLCFQREGLRLIIK